MTSDRQLYFCSALQLLLIYTTAVSNDAWGTRAGRTVLAVFIAQVTLPVTLSVLTSYFACFARPVSLMC